ncbi:MAG: TolC family protein, partial [Cyclobacteriaceae bacterium]
MFIRCLIIAGLLFAGSASRAQNSQMNLSQCLEYAKSNAINVQISRLDEEIASAKVKETAGLGLPQISGSVSLVNNTRLRRFFTSYSEDSFFFGGQSVPGLTEGDVVSAQNFFQLKSSGDAGLSISQLIFNGSYIVGLQASKAYKDLSVRNTDQKISDVVEQVTRAYYLVLVNRARVDLFDQNISRIDTLLRNTTALQKQGFAESIDVDRLKVALNNLKTEREKFLNLLDLSVELLKFQMNYPMDRELEVNGRIQDMKAEAVLSDYNFEWNYESRPEYRVLAGNKKLQQLSLRNNYAMAFPSIVA